jgi:hypothetical protein
MTTASGTSSRVNSSQSAGRSARRAQEPIVRCAPAAVDQSLREVRLVARPGGPHVPEHVADIAEYRTGKRKLPVEDRCHAGEQGVPYFRMSHEELRHEVEQAKSI